LIDRNLIKFNLTSQTKSLQPPGVFVDAHDVLYFNEHKGKHDAIHHDACLPPRRKEVMKWLDMFEKQRNKDVV